MLSADVDFDYFAGDAFKMLDSDSVNTLNGTMKPFSALSKRY